MNTSDIERLTHTIHTDATRLATGQRPDGTQGPTLATIHTVLADWAGIGWPSGSSAPSRGGDTTPLPERLAVAGLKDHFGTERLQLEVALRAAAHALADLSAIVARNTPLTLEQARSQPTATCLDCGRTVAATAVDPLKAGRCTANEDEPEVGCYGRWERERKRAQRGRDMAESVEAVPGSVGAGT